MKGLISTYGKTWHTWPTEQFESRLPLGVPSLMMAFIADGQLQPSLLQKRDEKFGVSTEAKSEKRIDIPAPAVRPGADAWKTGDAYQAELKKVLP